jgi:hypothetical protein
MVFGALPDGQPGDTKEATAFMLPLMLPMTNIRVQSSAGFQVTSPPSMTHTLTGRAIDGVARSRPCPRG